MKRMSAVDAAFLYGETPSWHMHVSAVLIADPSRIPGGFSVDELKRRTERRLHLAPQFRWRLVDVPLGVERPGWVDDPDFSIDAHIRRIGVPAPGGPQQVGNLIGDLVSLKLDRGKPLWEFWVIEGLEGGRIAILAKVHHAIIDGISGSELATVLFDLEPDPPETEVADEAHEVEPLPDPAELFWHGVGDLVRLPWRVARFGGQSLRQGLTFLGFQRQSNSPAAPFQAPRTSFNAPLTAGRRFAYTSVSLDDVKTIRWAFDVKVNDVVLALCAGALRRYLEDRDELPSSPLVAQVPVSLRTEDGDNEVGTKVGAMFASLATDVSNPALRLLAIHDSTRSAKEMQRALAADKIMGLTETAPPALVSLAARMYTGAQLERRTPPIMNLIISNVPGPPFPLYVAGAEIEALYPMGPLLYGTGVNITVFSYRDRVDFGFMVCRDLVPDSWAIAEGIPVALQELLEAAEDADPDLGWPSL
jgi:diacylglycerol O-acyltransferase / wax synthase